MAPPTAISSEIRPKLNSDALAEIKSYEKNQSSFGIFRANATGNWAVFSENDMVQACGQP